MDTDHEKSCQDKMVFDTKKEAQTAATVALHQRGIKLRPYKCRECELWHLTSNNEDD